jgi:hypothetical protein
MLPSDLVDVDIFVTNKFITRSTITAGDADKIKEDIQGVWGYKKEKLIVVAYEVGETRPIISMTTSGRTVRNDDGFTKFIKGTVL